MDIIFQKRPSLFRIKVILFVKYLETEIQKRL